MIKFKGVLIGKDIEVVLTDRYEIAFRRSLTGEYLESVLIKIDFQSEKVIRKCIGVCRTQPSTTLNEKTKPVNWLYAFNTGIDNLQNNETMVSLLNAEVFTYDTKDNKTFMFKFYDGQVYTAICHETFTTEELHPECVSPSEASIGICLQNWNIGCRDLLFTIDGKETFIGVTINTRKHMYIFEMTPKSIYCRAARYYTCNKGVVFNQNFRQGVEAYMLKDNSMVMEDLVIDESLFNSNACVWKDNSVYWSVSSVDDNVITLNGCQGDTYKWKRPVFD